MQRTVTTTLLLLCWLLLPPIVWGQEDNTLLMPTSTWDNNEHKVGDTPLILYDSGGADGNAQANKGGKIVFTPEQAGKCIEIEIQELALANQDELRTFHPLMQFLKNDVFDDFIGCLIV